MLSQATALLALAAGASAHIVMTYPVPFNKATLNNSPLEPADFPCKQRAGVYDITEMNQWNAGETKQISFMGSAVHGGGSCQFSITTDPKPSLSTQWKVIHSIEGGCPASVPGNLPSGSATDVSGPKFPVTMPKNLPAGQYTFAWTWLNKQGNREFYMNCAPIKVGSGSTNATTTSVKDAIGSLPDMFVANLPATECTTEHSVDFQYPNPGQSVAMENPSAFKPSKAVSGSGCAKQNKMGAGNGELGSPAAGSPSQPSASGKPTASSPAGQAPQQPAAPSNPGGVSAPGASSAPASGPTAQPAPPASQHTTLVAQPKPSAQSGAPKDSPSNPPTNSNPENTTAPPTGECTPCTTNGAIVCIGSKQFGICNAGCAVAQDIATGMTCTNGAVVASAKRHIHIPRGHLRRRFSNSHLI